MKRRAPVIITDGRRTEPAVAGFRAGGRRVNDPISGLSANSRDQANWSAMARILLAEDDDQMRAFLNRGLRRAGHAVDAVGDGEAALERSRNAEYDLLLADVVMPGIDGIELARRVPCASRASASCSLPGLPRSHCRTTAWRNSGREFVAKPFHLRHLIAEIEALLAQ